MPRPSPERLDPLVLCLVAEKLLEQGEIDADERGQAETLVLELIVASHLGLAIVVDENHAVVMDQIEQLFQALDGAVVVQHAFAHALGEFQGELAMRQSRHVHGPVIVLGGEQAIDFQQFLLRPGSFDLARSCSMLSVISVRPSSLTLRATQVRTYSCRTASPSSSSTAAGRQSSR